jgi:hypothetical protein
LLATGEIFFEEYEGCVTDCMHDDIYRLKSTSPDYGGISASRLEVLEDRLKEDVISELIAFGGK